MRYNDSTFAVHKNNRAEWDPIIDDASEILVKVGILVFPIEKENARNLIMNTHDLMMDLEPITEKFLSVVIRPDTAKRRIPTPR